MIRRLRIHHILAGVAVEGGDTIIDCRSADIPNTIVMMIRSFPPNIIAVSLRPEGGGEMIAAAEREARRKGIRIIWMPRRVRR